MNVSSRSSQWLETKHHLKIWPSVCCWFWINVGCKAGSLLQNRCCRNSVSVAAGSISSLFSAHHRASIPIEQVFTLILYQTTVVELSLPSVFTLTQSGSNWGGKSHKTGKVRRNKWFHQSQQSKDVNYFVDELRARIPYQHSKALIAELQLLKSTVRWFSHSCYIFLDLNHLNLSPEPAFFFGAKKVVWISLVFLNTVVWCLLQPNHITWAT